jgi:O-antigen ligase
MERRCGREIELSRHRAARRMTQLTTEQLATWGDRAAGQATGFQRFVAGWAALGVTLGGATQLRVGGLPVGPSEFVLAAWLLFVGFLLLRGARFAGTQVTIIIGGYWLAALTLLGFGAAIAVQTRRAELGAAIQNGMAFAYIGTLITFLTLRLYDGQSYTYHLYFARLVFLFHVLAAGVLLGVAMVVPQIGIVRFWYGGIRFAGWAENPNQMALAMAAMPFLGWWLMRNASGSFGKVACLVGIALCGAAGFATQSDGLRVAWVGSLGVVAVLLFYRVTMRGRSRWLHISHVIMPALVVVAGISLSDEIATYVYDVADGIYAEGHQGEQRFTLWAHGMEAIAASPLVGFGPGAFSGYGGPFEGNEAHNSFIDWGMSTGVIGVAIYVSLLAWCARRALRSREPMLVAMLVSVVMVSTFGYVLRHPDFWVVVVLVLVLSERAIASRARQVSWSSAPSVSSLERNSFR